MRLGMHWGALAFGMTLGLVPGTGRAEEQQSVRRTVVLAQPLSGLAASVEHAVSERVALAATALVTVQFDQQASGPFGSDVSTLRLGGGLQPGVHFYLVGRAPEGFWVGPYLEASMVRSMGDQVELVLPGQQPVVLRPTGLELEYGGSARVGYTAILSPGFSAQVGLGLGATVRDTPAGSGWRVGPRVSLGLGWAF